MKELLNIFIGQAGVQQGNAALELLCTEHGVGSDGIIMNDNDITDGIDRLFSVTNSKAFPLSLIIDTERNVIDEVRRGEYRQCFNDDFFISGQEDTFSIFPRGYFGEGRILINRMKKCLNKLLETCDSLQGLCIWHSTGGGTGSGLHSLFVEEMECIGKITKFEMITYPSYYCSPVIVEPYNSILSQHYTMDSLDMSFMVDNEALYRVANRGYDVKMITYSTINRIIAQLYNYVTAAVRFRGSVSSMLEMMHNLIPYPRIHYPVCCLSSVSSTGKEIYKPHTVEYVTNDVISEDLNLLSCSPFEGYYMACCFMYRGPVCTAKMHETLRMVKNTQKIKFVDWCPTGIKVIICNKPAFIISNKNVTIAPLSLGIISNNSAVTDPMLRNFFKFHNLFKKRSFVHWFIGEGLEECEFNDGLENIACLISDYGCIGNMVDLIHCDDEKLSNPKLEPRSSKQSVQIKTKVDSSFEQGHDKTKLSIGISSRSADNTHTNS